MRVVFMGTPEISVPSLEAISKAHEVVAVYTQPDRPMGRGLEVQAPAVKKKALQLGLKVIQPEKINQQGVFAELEALRADVFVVSAYAQILKKEILALPKQGCVNIHYSLLPRWRGAAPVQWSILEGDAVTGVTTMMMSEGLDEGDILEVATCALTPSTTAMSLSEKLSEMSAPLILSTLDKLSTLPRIPQDHAKSTYAKKLRKELQWIAPQESCLKIDRKIRALAPWPGTSIKLKSGERIKILAGIARPGIQAQAGNLLQLNGMLVLGCPDGIFEITSLQLDGKKPMEASSFMNGLKGQGRSLPLELSATRTE